MAGHVHGPPDPVPSLLIGTVPAGRHVGVRPAGRHVFLLVSVLGLLVLAQGTSSITQAIALREVSQFWGVMLFSGILITALGLWVSTSDRVWTLAARSAFVLLAVGWMAVFRGVQDETMSVTLLQVRKQNDRPWPSGEDGSVVPPQRDSSSRQRAPARTAA